MEVYLSVCSEYGNQEIKKSVKLINESIENHGLFQKEIPSAVESHLKEINVLLQKAKTRHHGFKLLIPLIQQGSPALLEKRCDLWFGACCQAITSLSGSAEKIDACKIILILLKASGILPELQKTFLSKLQASLLQSLATADSSWDSAAYECLYELIKLLPGQCLPHKVLIEERALKYLDNPLSRVGEDDIVKKAGQVFAVLPLPGMGGKKALGKAEARGRQLVQLLALAHKTMDSLFEGVIEKEAYNHSRQSTLKVPPIKFVGKDSSETISGFLAAVTRLGNILKFIAQMVTCEGNQCISVVPHHILSPVFRLLQVDSKVLKTFKSQEHQILSFLIVSLHHHCLWLLRDMIMSIGESIDIYYGVIGELLVSMIKMSFTQEDDESGWCADGAQTRIMAYCVLTTVLKVSRGRHAPSKVLANLIVKDILPRNQQVTLQGTQNKGLQSLTIQKKKKKKGYAINQSTATNQSGPFFQSEVLGRITRAALTLTETLFIYASHSMTHKVKQILQKNIMSLTEIVSGGGSLPIAYSSDKTRAQLYRTLASIATHPDPRCPPPYTVMLHLLLLGQQDPQMLVVTTCQTLMGNISFIVANPKISLMDMALQNSHKNSIREGDDDDLEEYPPVRVPDQSLHEKQETEDEGLISDEDSANEVDEDDMNVEESGRDPEANEDGEVVKGTEDSNVSEELSSNGDEDVACEDIEEEQLEVEEDRTSEVIETEVICDKMPSETLKADENEVIEIIVKKDKDFKASKSKTKNGETDIEKTGNAKRKALEKSPISSKKNKKNSNDSNCGPSLEEMLSCFVDADPDE
ncbi:proline-, glutamic acid- and leucine-rich protein 1-like [Palaemon carinicauda]|uniref:proline-, glutamic acid- and leucine-rich protein 1-like n=1 Tax=Palaemon carinicauda TaxID=392227 RepID=UPI0035B5977A